ncbi:MAG: M15 family metallopeptidase [Ignavibacteriae bacterium]|nr:M15 family metallopeptidase [Ignavibacteriota bacterium]
MNIRKVFFSVVIYLCFTAVSFAQYDLVDVKKLDSTIMLDIKYATENNFTGKKIYDEAKFYLRKEPALKILEVQKELQKFGLGLKIFDGYRPLSVQKKFWEIMPDERYVADPKKGSRHNRGMAVDLTLVDKDGNEISMPTPYDDFTEKASRDYFDLPAQILINRKFLEDIMVKYGFTGFPTEWWHFDYEGWEKYDILDVDFKEIEN